ncbi:hypothetical protein AALF20_22475, partial [Enterococcus avium]
NGEPIGFDQVTVVDVSQVNTKKEGKYVVLYRNKSLEKSVVISVQPLKNKFEVSFKPSPGGTLIGNTTVKVDKGTKITTLPTVKADSGY